MKVEDKRGVGADEQVPQVEVAVPQEAKSEGE